MKNKSSESKTLQGSIAIAETICSLEPGVIGAYPITPQTHIVEHLAKLTEEGLLKGKYIIADSEFSAASILFGAAAAGVRSYSASSSQGLLLMTEVIFNMAGTRLPGVFSAVNRSLSPPINIQVDHQDSMTLRDSGVIQLYVENIQEAVDTHIQIYKVAEDPEVLLPAMVCMDGWIISHAYEPVTLWQKELVQDFVGTFDPPYKVDPLKPLTYGALADDDKITEFKCMTDQALRKSADKITETAEQFRDLFGNYYGGLVEKYKTEDAEIVFVAMGSIVATLKVAIDMLRKKGRKVGLLKIRSFRPFPVNAIKEVLPETNLAIVIDRSFSNSAGGILGTEIKASLYGSNKPFVINYIAGIGGREIYPQTAFDMLKEADEMLEKGKIPSEAIFYNLNMQMMGG
ncbi:transketolase C-terminal domain-containing protein [Halomonas sp.]|uniref:transketolase C-terminal domain-containing protein n=1 Tax=Halomonas sp. TaxID=1486246 RepID=UPI003458409D